MNQKESSPVTATMARSRIGAMSWDRRSRWVSHPRRAHVVPRALRFLWPRPDLRRGSAPSGEHLFELITSAVTSSARVLYAVVLLPIGSASTLIALLFGAIIGSIAAVVRKSFSEAIMRLMDIIMAVLGIAMAAVSVLVFGRTPSAGNTWAWWSSSSFRSPSFTFRSCRDRPRIVKWPPTARTTFVP